MVGVQIEHWAARGGFADVWKARRGSAELALKVARARDGATTARFQREAGVLQWLEGRGAPRFAANGVLADGRAYLLIEWLPQPTLAEWLTSLEQPPSPASVVRVGRAVVACVERIIACGVLHRDLKPENLIVELSSESAQVRAIDFGSSRFIDGRAPSVNERVSVDATAAGVLVGTEEYLSPERIGGGSDDERSEVYTLGVILYELATLRPPFIAGDSPLHSHVALLPPSPSALSSIPAQLEALLLDCLAKDPRERPPTVATLSQRLSVHELGGEGKRPPPALRSAPQLPVEPAVLLLASSVVDHGELANMVGAASGFVARLRGAEAMCVFVGGNGNSAADSAVSVALSWTGADSRRKVTLHAAQVVVRRSPDGAWSAYGDAIDMPQTWRPRAESAISFTESFTQAAGTAQLGRLRRVDPEPEGSHILIGRDELVGAVTSELRASSSSSSPRCVLIEGESGSGKSRIADAIVAASRQLPGCTVIGPVRADPQRRVGVRHLLEALLDSLPPPPFSATKEDLVTALVLSARPQPLVLVLDDGELAEDAVLDALEAALLSGTAASLAIVCVATPALSVARPMWGRRVSGFRALSLGGLEPAAGKELLRTLLRPAEYIPERALERLGEAASYLPGALVQLTASIHGAGLVRARPEGAGHYLEIGELDLLPMAQLWQWVAAQELAALEPAFAEGAKVAAQLGPVVEHQVLRHVQAARASAGTRVVVDAGVLLEQLMKARVIEACQGKRESYAFRSARVAAGLRASLPDFERQVVHRAALDFHRQRPAPDLPSIARHAWALGERAVAAGAESELGHRATSEQRWVDAEIHYSSALASLPEGEASVTALIGRARARCRLYRLKDAAADLEAALDSSRRTEDLRWECAASLELATVHDWMNDYAASAQRAEVGSRLAQRTNEPRLLAAATVAEGRSAWRRGAVAEAIELLSRGIDLAVAESEAETRTIGALLLGCALVQAKRLEEAETCLARVIDEAAARDDRLHLCAGLGNRAFLWAELREVTKCIEDLTRAVDVARQLGHPGTERTALLNLAEVSYWAGRDDEALLHVERARVLEERFLPRPLHSAVLLCARLAAVRQQYERAHELLDWLSVRELPEANAHSALAFVAALRHVLTAAAHGAQPTPAALAPLTWLEIEALGEGFLDEERVELRYWRAHCDFLRGAKSDAAELVALASPHVWGSRLTRLVRASLSP